MALLDTVKCILRALMVAEQSYIIKALFSTFPRLCPA